MSREKNKVAAHAAASDEMQTKYPEAGHTTTEGWTNDPKHKGEYRQSYERELASREKMGCSPDDDADLDEFVRTCPKYPLRFRVAWYDAYEVWSWSKFYRVEKVGEIGQDTSNASLTMNGKTLGKMEAQNIRGDRTNVRLIKEGYVYVFEKGSKHGGSYQIWKAFKVSGGGYGEISVSPGNTSHAGGGGGAPYIEIPKYFSGNTPAKGTLYVVESEIPLSEERLFSHKKHALVHTAGKRGAPLSVTREELADPKQETRSGPQILQDYRKGTGVSPTNYDRKILPVGGLPGVELLRPHVPSEIERRAERFRTRLKKFQEWFHDETRRNEAFLSQSVESVLRQDRSRESHINKKVWGAWKHNDSQEYRANFFPVHYAVESLVYWMESEHVQECLRDYNFGTDEHKEEADVLFENGIRYLGLTQQGTEFLGKQVDVQDSYWNRRTSLLSLKTDYVDYDKPLNGFFQVRKYSHVFFAIATEIVPILINRFGDSSLNRLIKFAQETAGVTISKLPTRINRLIPVTVDVLDIDKLGTKLSGLPDARAAKYAITCFETINVAIAVYGLANANSLKEKAYNGVNLVGALLDFGSNSFLVTHRLERFGKLWAGRTLNGMILISGIIDATLGLINAVGAAKRGNMSGAFGWSIFALGGAMVAIGAGIRVAAVGIRVAGVATTVGSAGTAAAPGGGLILTGLILEGIGLAIIFFCDDDELDDWLTECKFGKSPSNKSVEKQINDLNDIMCKFEVDTAYTTTEMNFRNHTKVVVSITPRVITEFTELKFTGMRALAEARWVEYIAGNKHSLTQGMAGSKNPVFTPAEPDRGVTIKREASGRITRIDVAFYYEMDIDRVKGNIELNINNGTLQNYDKDFNLARGMFE